MAYLKITPIKTNTHLKQSLEYIQNPQKTDDKFLVEGYMCFYDYAYESFNDTLNHSLRKSGNNIAHHIIQSFSPDDNVDPQQINEIGKKLVERMYPNHQYVIATHIDGEHIHNHIILCATNRVTHKKLISNKNTLQKMRDISDELCKEYGLSVIKPLPKTKREILKADIDNAILLAANMEQFIEIMQKKGYEVKQNKYIAFKGSYMGTFIRSKSLGTAYTEFKITKRIENKAEVKNQKINLFYNKSFGSSKRKEIRRDIDNVLSHTNSFDEFIFELSKKYDIKQG
ncbi:MAG: relaxase/mobilization nuclease domain-containing protein, partial [Firmicutes bacterium]|nr:relaxase/mobilization nuclease domain-containing protein [Bacillota bacterium]